MAETTAIAVTEQKMQEYVNDVVPALVKNYSVRPYDAQVWIRTVKLCIVESPELMACLQTDAGRISLKHALRFAATTGLSLNPAEGKAALVTIKGKVYYWPMKNGLVELVLNTGAVERVRMNAVRAQDHFRINETMDGDTYEFSPNVKTRGDIIGFFCAIKLKTGPSLVEYMTAEEVRAHRDQYGKGLDRSDSAWKSSFEGMGIKTVVKRAIKRLALPPEAEKVVDAALADGEAIEAEFVPASARQEKGASAEDVQAKLAAAAPQAPTTVPGAQGSPAGSESAPAIQPQSASAAPVARTVDVATGEQLPAAEGKGDQVEIF